MLTGRPARLIDRNGAPAGERHVLLVDPPVMEPASGARASAETLAQRWALPFLRAGRQTIVFGRSRVAVEILLTGLRESLRESYGPRSRVRGYRGGYLPTERRAIERGLRDGEILGVVATNALELGVDIGRLDVAILAGYPGSVAATWQQIGRAGRRLGTSVAVLVASGRPVDQYVIHHPEFLLESAPEEARLDPDNLHVLLAHLRAATFELPFDPGEVFGPGPADDLLAFLAEERQVRQADDGRWYWSSENFPASEISLRSAAPENVVIIDTTPDRPKVLGEVDLFSAQVLVHERAIYIHESVQYYVDRLEWHERKAYVHRVDVDHYTYANRAVTLKPLEVFAEGHATNGRRIHGEVMVASLVTLFKKLKFLTDENVGWGPIDLPELELQTTAYWLTAEAPRERWRRDELDVALMGAGRAIQTVASVLLMVDPRDLGLVTQVRSPHSEEPTIYLYEAVPGGIGLSERLWERHDDLIDGSRGPHPFVRRAMRAARPAPVRASSPRSTREPSACASSTSWAPDGPRARAGDRPAGAAGPSPGPIPGDHRPTRDRPGAPSRSRAGRADPSRADGRRRRRRGSNQARAGPWCGAPRRPDPSRSTATLLAGLPGHPDPTTPLLCLDTETTGLATAAGTVAWLVGLGWWVGDSFHQVQLLVPDHADEPAMLAALDDLIPADGWLVTYNGRGFDWPLLVARYRLHRSPAPDHAGHLDLLPVVRRLFRHRMADARLRTAEEELLGIRRHGDVDGGEIASLYLGFLRGGPAGAARGRRAPQRSGRPVARPPARTPRRPGSPIVAPGAASHPGDLAGLARSYARQGRLDRSARVPRHRDRDARASRSAQTSRAGSDRRTHLVVAAGAAGLRDPPRGPRANPARRSGRTVDDGPDRHRAGAAPAAGRRPRGGGPILGLAPRRAGTGPASSPPIESAKLHEHHLRDLPRALELVDERSRPGGSASPDRLPGTRPGTRPPAPGRAHPATAGRPRREPGTRIARADGEHRSGRRAGLAVVADLRLEGRDAPPAGSVSRARRTLTAARSGTPSRPTASTASDPAAAANRRSSGRRDRCRPGDGRAQRTRGERGEERVAGTGRVHLVGAGRQVSDRPGRSGVPDPDQQAAGTRRGSRAGRPRA